MSALFNYFFELCLLRVKPQDLPASGALLGLVILANITVGVLAFGGFYGGVTRALMAGVVESLFFLTALGLLLYCKRLLSRFTQSATALLGSSTLLAIILIPLYSMGGGTADHTAMAVVADLGALLLLVWSLTIMGHILHHTLEIPFGHGVLLGMIYFLISSLLVGSLFPLS
ncbi:MAG: hypothetical protein L3J26_05665 [Candidatus Polarisedimenticolaceae bacterium]|nr:hypothetical protein [Candidatus Polarisedimenticolaceae bacterium]